MGRADWPNPATGRSSEAFRHDGASLQRARSMSAACPPPGPTLGQCGVDTASHWWRNGDRPVSGRVFGQSPLAPCSRRDRDVGPCGHPQLCIGACVTLVSIGGSPSPCATSIRGIAGAPSAWAFHARLPCRRIQPSLRERVPGLGLVDGKGYRGSWPESRQDHPRTHREGRAGNLMQRQEDRRRPLRQLARDRSVPSSVRSGPGSGARTPRAGRCPSTASSRPVYQPC